MFKNKFYLEYFKPALPSFIVLLFLILMASLYTLSIKVDKDAAINAAATYGFNNTEVYGSHTFLLAWHGCTVSDDVAYDLIGKNNNNQLVKLVVCETSGSAYGIKVVKP